MKKILFISPHDLNQRFGGALATLAYYNALKELFADNVYIMMPAESECGTFSNVISVPARSHFKAFLSGSMHRYKTFLYNYLKKNNKDFSLCVINGGMYAGDMMNMIHGFGLKIMVIHHNLEREYAMDNKSRFTLWGRTSFFVDRNERRAYLKADVNCFLTNDDLELFRSYYGESCAKSCLIGVFEASNVPLPQCACSHKKEIVITGSMNTLQTMYGIKDIHKHYYDIVSELCFDWYLVIAGRNPHQEVYNLQKENPSKIRVIPNPPVMDDVTCSASIFLCPTNVGGGLKLRVMDGLRVGLPILVHKVSARGYEIFKDKPYFRIYKDRDSFRKGLCDIIAYCQESFDAQSIQADYKEWFSFHSGCLRIKDAVEKVFN